MATPTRPDAGSRPSRQPASSDITKLLVGVVLIGTALVALMVTRQLMSPVVSLATSHTCTVQGRELSRPVTGYEKASRLSPFNRTDGACFFGPVTLDDDDDPEEGIVIQGETYTLDEVEDMDKTLTLSLADFETSGMYRAVRIMSTILQLGAASIVVRLLADPLMDRFTR